VKREARQLEQTANAQVNILRQYKRNSFARTENLPDKGLAMKPANFSGMTSACPSD